MIKITRNLHKYINYEALWLATLGLLISRSLSDNRCTLTFSSFTCHALMSRRHIKQHN